MTGDDKYSLLNKDNLLQHFQIQLSQKPQNFSEIFFEFSKFRFNSDHLEKKKVTLIADVFLNCRIPKNMVR